jgi:virginiamycin B lyase
MGEKMRTRLSERVTLLTFLVLCAAVSARSQALPEGNGKTVVEAKCIQCHDLTRVTNNRMTPAEWQSTIVRMVDYGAELSDAERTVVTDYLSRNFAGASRPTGQVIPGSVEVTIREWKVPTPGSRPHDPLVAPDGSIWYTGQMANVLGRFDPKTQQFKEYHLSPRSLPHGLQADKEGNIWFTAQGGAYVGKLDPKTGNVKEYKMPNEDLDPHTPIIDHDGTVWFTMQGASMVGRINPKTGEVKVVPTPTPNVNPYGMVVSSKNEVFFCEFRSNKLAKIDKNTMEITEYTLPNPQSRPRRIAITPDDRIWYGDYSRGYLGVYDPKTGASKEWPSPSGPKSQPYGIVAIGDILWYSESGVDKNTLVRFDPKSEKFQSWLIPSGGGVVRNMSASPNGDVWMATSGVNGIAVAEVKN